MPSPEHDNLPRLSASLLDAPSCAALAPDLRTLLREGMDAGATGLRDPAPVLADTLESLARLESEGEVLAAAILRTRIPPVTWAAVVLATVGLGVLALNGFSIGYGEVITLASAVLYALHIVGLGAWSTAQDAVGMTILQIMVIAVVCTLATAHDGIVLPDRTGDWLSVGYMAVVVGALGLLGQTWAQAHLPPTRSAIIMSMEPVFASFFAVWLGGEDVTTRLLLGGAMVLVAMLTVELAPRRAVEGEVPHIAV